jgi:hypothetical protein
MPVEGGVSNLSDAVIRSVQYEITVNGAGALADLQTRLGEVRTAQATLTAMFGAGLYTQAEYQRKLDALSSAEHDLEGRVKLATAALANQGQITDKLVNSLKRAEGQTRNSAWAFQNVAYAIDDVQYGAAALTNNIVGLTTAFGGNSTAVAIGAAALTTAFAVYVNYDAIVRKINDVVLSGIPITKSSADEIEELGKKTNKSADELARYNELKEKQKRADATSSIKGAEAETQEDAVTKALKAAGGGKKVKGQLAGVLATSPVTADEALDKKADDAEAMHRKYIDLEKRHMASSVDVEMYKKLAEEARKKATDARNAKANTLADSMVGESTVDPDQLRALQGYVAKNPGAFSPKLAKGLEKATPEAVAKAVRDRENKEGNQAFDKFADAGEDEHEKYVKDKAANLRKGMMRDILKGESFTPQEIQAKLAASGEKPVDPGTARDILNAIIKGSIEEVSKQAQEMGGVPFAQARAAMIGKIDEQDQRQARHQTPEQREAKAAAAKADREVTKADREADRKRAKVASGAKTSFNLTSFKTMKAEMERRARLGEDPAAVDEMAYKWARDITDANPDLEIDQADDIASGEVKRARDAIAGKEKQKAARRAAYANPDLRMKGGNGGSPQAANDPMARKLDAMIDKLGQIADNTGEMTDGVPAVYS